MFEGYTYELLLEDVLNNAPEGIDTRPGSIFYDAVSGILIKVAKLYTDLDLVLGLSCVDTATGEYLDQKASEYGITRLDATKCCYIFEYEGTRPDVGERFFTDGLYFILKETEAGVLYLEAEQAGTGGNNVYSGTPAVPVNNIQGLDKATFGEIYEIGTDEENDESLRSRIREKIAGPAENGNKQHYKTWCEAVEGVGQARIFPLWNGPNTVKAVLINPLGTPCNSRIVSAVQEHIDPATKGYTATVDGKTYIVGDGLGEGVANLGAHFTATSADEVKISVEFSAQLITGATIDNAKEEVSKAITEYLKDLVLSTEEAADVVVRVSSVGAIISGVSSILDYSNLKLNGDTNNISPGEDGVPVLEEVDIGVL